MAIAPSSQEQKSNSGLVTALLAALLLLGGGAGWYFMQAKAAAKSLAESGAAAPVFMTLETFTVNLQSGTAEQYLQTDITLQLGKQAHETLVRQYLPLVKSETLMILSSKSSAEILGIEGKSALSREIADRINGLLPQDGETPVVTGVFFTSFIIQ
jgi:flagellar FliL protein